MASSGAAPEEIRFKVREEEPCLVGFAPGIADIELAPRYRAEPPTLSLFSRSAWKLRGAHRPGERSTARDRWGTTAVWREVPFAGERDVWQDGEDIRPWEEARVQSLMPAESCW